MRTKAYYREMRHKAICRKKHISRAVYGIDWYKVDGAYSKGKIHCGCGLCKFGRKYGLPTFQDRKSAEIVRLALQDLEEVA